MLSLLLSALLSWQAPLPPPVVVQRPFSAPTSPWSPGHRGVDLAASTGATIRAANDGTVVFAGMLAGRPVISIAHAAIIPGLGTGWRTTYDGVRPSVRVGDRVGRGQAIGTLEAGSHCTCLHWGLKRGDEYADPMLLLSRPIVLKPTG
ncbi:MAG: murein hydrolase activator EnvC family protein [Candidatus Nanopelagicales bacterium]